MISEFGISKRGPTIIPTDKLIKSIRTWDKYHDLKARLVCFTVRGSVFPYIPVRLVLSVKRLTSKCLKVYELRDEKMWTFYDSITPFHVLYSLDLVQTRTLSKDFGPTVSLLSMDVDLFDGRSLSTRKSQYTSNFPKFFINVFTVNNKRLSYQRPKPQKKQQQFDHVLYIDCY